MNRYRFALIPLAIASAFSSAQAADDKRFYFAPMGTYVLADKDRYTDDAFGGTLAFGTRLTGTIDIELRGMYVDYGDRDPQAQDPGCGVLLNPCPDSESLEGAGGGLGINYFLTPDGSGPYLHGDVMAGDRTLFNVGLGWDFFFSPGGIALRAEALYHIEKFDDDLEPNSDFHEPLFNLGLRIPLGAAPVDPPPPPPEPVTVVPPVPPPPAVCSDGADNDGDGAIDFPSDKGCTDASDGDEFNPICKAPEPGQPVNLEGCGVGDTIVLQGVTFEFDQARLTPNAKVILDGVADALSARPDIKVEIGGHTDSKGSDAYNLKLSERRAASVKDYLTSRGVASDRMSSRGYGEAVPVADNATDEGRELNRRVELKVTASSGSVTIAPTVRTAENAAPLPGTGAIPPVPPAPPPPASAPAPTGSTAVTIVDFAFSPATITVPAGTTVSWTNKDGSNHTVTFADEKSDRLSMDAVHTRTFMAPGVYEYECSIHPQMKGKVVVE